MKIFPLGVRMVQRPLVQISDPITPHISETIRARKLKFHTHLDGSSAPFGNDNFSARGRFRGAVPPSVNLGPLYFVFCSLTTLRQIIFMFFILTFLRHVCCQGHWSRSNVVVSYVKDSHYATALCGVV